MKSEMLRPWFMVLIHKTTNTLVTGQDDVVAEEIHDEHRGQPHTDDSFSAVHVTIVSYVTAHSTRSTSTLNVPVNEKPMSG